MEWCLHTLRKFNGGGSERVWYIVTGNETFVYQNDPEVKQQSSVYFLPGESPPVKFKSSRSTPKHTIAVFFAKSGHVASVLLQEKKTVSAEWYINICLSKVFEAWCARSPYNDTRGLLLNHDNASAHTAATTLDYLETNCVQLVTQNPEFPGLSPL